MRPRTHRAPTSGSRTTSSVSTTDESSDRARTAASPLSLSQKSLVAHQRSGGFSERSRLYKIFGRVPDSPRCGAELSLASVFSEVQVLDGRLENPPLGLLHSCKILLSQSSFSELLFVSHCEVVQAQQSVRIRQGRISVRAVIIPVKKKKKSTIPPISHILPRIDKQRAGSYSV